jgi:hypothetical protein
MMLLLLLGIAFLIFAFIYDIVYYDHILKLILDLVFAIIFALAFYVLGDATFHLLF